MILAVAVVFVALVVAGAFQAAMDFPVPKYEPGL